MFLKRDKHVKFAQKEKTKPAAGKAPELEKHEDFEIIPKTALNLLKIRKPKSFCDEKHFMSLTKNTKSNWLKEEEDSGDENKIDGKVVEFLEIGPDEKDELNKSTFSDM